MGFTIEDKALIIINNLLINNRFFDRWTTNEMTV
jgi:hypothetical protein